MATEAELAAVRPRLLGLIPEERIVAVEIARPPRGAIEQLLALGDLTSTVSDALDRIGAGGAVGGSLLEARAPGARVCGPAITARYVQEGGSVGALVARGERARLVDRDLYGVGETGDVAVFDAGGFTGASVLGGLSARWARARAIAGCIVDGAIRDVEAVRGAGVPVWSRALTPVSGKHRLEGVEINGAVSLAGVPVHPGDVVCADETGVAVIPLEVLGDVLRLCAEAEAAERELVEAIARDAPVDELVRILRPERW